MIRIKVYIHGDRDAMINKGIELGLTGEALSMFGHACDEFELELEVNKTTGISKVVRIDGKVVS